MKPYIEKLKEYLAQNEPRYPYQDMQTLIETLYIFYTELNPVDSPELQHRWKLLHPFLDSLPPKEQTELFDNISGVCIEQEHAAFLEGFRAGARLVVELYEA